MIRRSFLKRMALAAAACAFLDVSRLLPRMDWGQEQTFMLVGSGTCVTGIALHVNGQLVATWRVPPVRTNGGDITFTWPEDGELRFDDVTFENVDAVEQAGAVSPA